MALTPTHLLLRLSHLEKIIINTECRLLDNESPQFRKIDCLYNHIFKDLKNTEFFDNETIEEIDALLDNSHIMFYLFIPQQALENIVQARNIIQSKITSSSIIVNRLCKSTDNSSSSADLGVLDTFPDLVKEKIGQSLKQFIVA